MRRRRHRRSDESQSLLKEVRSWAERISAAPEAIYVRTMTKKWASCSAGRLYFSSDLLAEPRRFRDVVIVHELLHLRIQNHGKLFKSLLSSFVPGWEQEIEGKASRICR